MPRERVLQMRGDRLAPRELVARHVVRVGLGALEDAAVVADGLVDVGHGHESHLPAAFDLDSLERLADEVLPHLTS